MNRPFKEYPIITLKGIAMGAADVVPGVSGGTIAFISGIYEELLDSIKSLNAASLKMLFTGRIADFWRAVNGNFLAALLTGIAISIFSLAKLITYLLTAHPVLVWAFFFGLVLASTWLVAKSIRQWNLKTIACFIIGGGIAYWITIATPAETPDDAWFVFLCGAIAICAMILPGISGSFILVLLGKYFYVMEAVKNIKLDTMVIFALGALTGITGFSRLLSYLLKHYHNATIALLSGFMLGSLNKVWPWKETVRTYVDRHGEVKPLTEANIWPDTQLWEAIGLALLGFVVVFLLEYIANAKQQKAKV